jgi:hypothetical protein
MNRTWLPILTALTLAGCARNGVLEVQLTLPPNPPAPEPQLYAVVTMEPGDADLSNAPIVGANPGTALAPGRSTVVSYSILAERFDADTQLQVAFCRSTNCTMDDLSTVRRKIYRFERPFYQGRRTRWAAEITAIPVLDEPSECVDRCFTFGCVEPDNATGDHCRRDGSHQCEEPGTPPPANICD